MKRAEDESSFKILIASVALGISALGTVEYVYCTIESCSDIDNPFSFNVSNFTLENAFASIGPINRINYTRRR